jgi:hypothetical protein
LHRKRTTDRSRASGFCLEHRDSRLELSLSLFVDELVFKRRK